VSIACWSGRQFPPPANKRSGKRSYPTEPILQSGAQHRLISDLVCGNGHRPPPRVSARVNCRAVSTRCDSEAESTFRRTRSDFPAFSFDFLCGGIVVRYSRSFLPELFRQHIAAKSAARGRIWGGNFRMHTPAIALASGTGEFPGRLRRTKSKLADFEQIVLWTPILQCRSRPSHRSKATGPDESASSKSSGRQFREPDRQAFSASLLLLQTYDDGRKMSRPPGQQFSIEAGTADRFRSSIHRFDSRRLLIAA